MAVWSAKFINDLPDSSFLLIGGGGAKNGDGKTTPRALRKFPYRDASSKVDLPHLRNALARIPQSNVSGAEKQKLTAKAKKLLAKENKARMAAATHLFVSTNCESGLRVAGPPTTDDSGRVERRYLKDLIHVGSFTHPIHGWTLDVDKARLDGWVETFRKMKDAGVPIEVVADHRKRGERADHIRGYVDELFVENDALYGVVTMTGEDGIKIAEAVRNVSVEVDAEFTDSEGTTWQDPITAIAVCEKPLIPGQQPFERIAASLVTHEDYTRVEDDPDDPKETDMNKLLSLVAKLTGKTVADLADDETAVKALETYQAAAGKVVKECTELKTERDKLKTEVEELRAKKAATSRPTVDEDALETMAEATEAKLEALVTAGKILPAVAKKLAAVLIGAEGSRRSVALSARVAKAAGLDGAIAKSVIDALTENDPVKLGEATKAQTFTLDRLTPGGEQKTLDPELDKRAASIYPQAATAAAAG